jgi:Domain of unknown function (DUF2610)
VKRFTVTCQFGDARAPFPVYIGQPARGCQPLKYQAAWLREERGGAIPLEVLSNFEKLHRIAADNNVSFEDLCMYALGAAQDETKNKE